MASYTANNKLIFSWNKGARKIPASLLSSYAESIIFDGIKRTLWHKGYQYGNSYYGSLCGENFNDFLNNTAKGSYSHAEGSHSTVLESGLAGHAEGIFGVAAGIASSVQGSYNYADGEASHAEGCNASSYAHGGHAEGGNTTVSQISTYGHAEGYKTTVSEIYAHAEGQETEASGKGSHAEGYKTKSSGQYSHAEGSYSNSVGRSSSAVGYFSYSIGDYSTASGISTQAYNYGEAAVGSYNKSITEAGKETIFTVGNGNSYEDRSNALEVTKNSTYIRNNPYFDKKIIANISYTYVDYLGDSANMDLVVHALLGEAYYYTPNPFGMFTTDNVNGGNLIASTASPYTYTATMEIGTYFHSGVRIWWPTRGTASGESLTYCSRYPANTIPDYLNDDMASFGYSYGLVNDTAITFEYFKCTSWDSYPTTPTTQGGGELTYVSSIPNNANGFTYIRSESTFTVIQNIKISYLNSTYIPYEKLRNVGHVHISYGLENNSPWFDNGVVKIPMTYKVNGRYVWYMGFSSNVNAFLNIYNKTTNAERKSGLLSLVSNGWSTKGWAQTSGTTSHTFSSIPQSVAAQALCFWIAIPNQYELVKDGDKYSVMITNSAGQSWNLVTNDQPLHVLNQKSLPGGSYNALGSYQFPYKFYYIDFNGTPLGNVSGFKITINTVR